LPDLFEGAIAGMRADLAKAGLHRVDFDCSVFWVGGPPAAPVVALLHGANDQAGTWAAVAPALAKRFRLIVPDLAGHGESAPAEGPLPLSLIVERFAAILDHEGARRATLVGNSMGGWVSLLYAFAHPDRVERLVLEDASGMSWIVGVPLFPKTREEAIVALRAVHGPAAEIPDWMIDSLIRRANDAPMLRVAQAGVLNYLVDARLSSLDVPTTLVWGADDGVLPVAYAHALQAKIRGSKLRVIEGAAHMPHRQQPEKFVACLTETFSPSARG
jgi:pimeloyl-ACP methyl ester carboxylesterase